MTGTRTNTQWQGARALLQLKGLSGFAAQVRAFKNGSFMVRIKIAPARDLCAATETAGTDIVFIQGANGYAGRFHVRFVHKR